MHIQHSSPSFILHVTDKYVPSKLLGFTWLLLLVILAKLNLLPYFGVNILAVEIFCSYDDAPLGQPTEILGQEPGTAPSPYLASPPYISISPWETYIKSSTIKCMVGTCKTMGVPFKPGFCIL